MGKRRLIHTIMAGAEANGARIEAAIRTHAAEERALAAGPGPAAPASAEHTVETPADPRALLEGHGEPEPRPFMPRDSQRAAAGAHEPRDVTVRMPTGGGEAYD